MYLNQYPVKEGSNLGWNIHIPTSHGWNTADQLIDVSWFFSLPNSFYYQENKLLLICINFTPKTSHNCLKKWYVPIQVHFTISQPPENVPSWNVTIGFLCFIQLGSPTGRWLSTQSTMWTKMSSSRECKSYRIKWKVSSAQSIAHRIHIVYGIFLVDVYGKLVGKYTPFPWILSGATPPSDTLSFGQPSTWARAKIPTIKYMCWITTIYMMAASGLPVPPEWVGSKTYVLATFSWNPPNHMVFTLFWQARPPKPWYLQRFVILHCILLLL